MIGWVFWSILAAIVPRQPNYAKPNFDGEKPIIGGISGPCEPARGSVLSGHSRAARCSTCACCWAGDFLSIFFLQPAVPPYSRHYTDPTRHFR